MIENRPSVRVLSEIIFHSDVLTVSPIGGSLGTPKILGNGATFRLGPLRNGQPGAKNVPC